MTLNKAIFATAISAAALVAATSASAATYLFTATGGNFSASGTFTTSDTALANGGFTILNTFGSVSLNGNNSFTITGPAAYAGADNVLFVNRPAQYLSFDGTSFTASNGASINLYFSAGYQYVRSTGNAGVQPLTSFTITPAVAAVPETATWGMMIAGFGMMGSVMRTRRRSTKVAYA